jgi:hypothetical protein
VNNPAPAADVAMMSWLNPFAYSTVASDAKGVITFPTLIPGATYRISGMYKEFKAEAGKALDLGDLTVKGQ